MLNRSGHIYLALQFLEVKSDGISVSDSTWSKYMEALIQPVGLSKEINAVQHTELEIQFWVLLRSSSQSLPDAPRDWCGRYIHSVSCSACEEILAVELGLRVTILLSGNWQHPLSQKRQFPLTDTQTNISVQEILCQTRYKANKQ